MRWLDRLTGEKRSLPEEPVVPGQWRYVAAAPLELRGALARAGDLLLPGEDGRLGCPDLAALEAEPRLVADAHAVRSLRLFGERIAGLDGRPWADWAGESPLLPLLKSDFEETELEREIAKRLGYLEAACRRPRSDLHAIAERQEVSRCKRPARRAPEVLAARSEDWERRTVWGVRPRRVLGLVREELLDLYENHVCVALVDHLERKLRKRSQEIRRAVRQLRQRGDYQALTGGDNYRRAHRMLALWGEAVEGQALLPLAEKLLRRIEALRRRVLALMDSSLYRAIGRRHGRAVRLRMTNVLTNDETYREVALLWRACAAERKKGEVEPDERWLMEQQAAQGFEDYAFLCLLRALSNLGYAPEDRQVPVGRAGEWRLLGGAGSLTLRWDEPGPSVLCEHRRELLRFVCLPATLAGSGAISGWLATLPRVDSLALVYLPVEREAAEPEDLRRLLSLGNEGDGPGPMLFTAAPWDLESVERFARALRWRIWGDLYRRYPERVDLPESCRALRDRPEWARAERDQLVVVQPVAPHEEHWTALDEMCLQQDIAAREAQAKLDACPTRGRRSHLRLRKSLVEQNERRTAATVLQRGISEALAVTERLCACPVCFERAQPRQFDHTEEEFRCRCYDCGATWGLRTCNACRHRLPFIEFDGNEPSRDTRTTVRRCGADILALPLAEGIFLCPECGQPSDGKGDSR